MDTEFTVGDLRKQLAGIPDDTKLTFHAGLTFYRLKRWSDDEFILEFSEMEADLSPQFRKAHPNIVAAFCRFSSESAADIVYVPRL